jgi:hypothetical protein
MKVFLLISAFIFSFCIDAQDTVIVQIAHGSKPRKKYKEEPKTLGGKLGGHVVIQIGDSVYGFYFIGRRVHAFPHRKNKSGLFHKNSLRDWSNTVKNKKLTCVFIPVTAEEKKQLLNFYHSNLIIPSYDYAFFGKRCAASCYINLKSIHKMKGGSYFFSAFYPKQFRKKLLRQSKKRGYRITVRPGSEKRIWEGD